MLIPSVHKELLLEILNIHCPNIECFSELKHWNHIILHSLSYELVEMYGFYQWHEVLNAFPFRNLLKWSCVHTQLNFTEKCNISEVVLSSKCIRCKSIFQQGLLTVCFHGWQIICATNPCFQDMLSIQTWRLYIVIVTG